VSRTSDTLGYALAGALALTACVEPRQYGGPIPVDQAGLEARLTRLCTFTGQTEGCVALAAAEEHTKER